MVLIRTLLLAVLGIVASWPAAALDPSAMSTDEIVSLQRRLADAGCYRGAADGVAGRGTLAALDRCPLMDPMLRIEAGRHAAILRSLDLSADQSRLVTGSEDKTVRLWHLPDGKLERVLRVPVGGGNEGKVNAVAISPDGTVVAAAGWLSPDTGDEHVYLFDAATGEVVRRLGPLPPAVVDKLAFSGDGRRLAVGMGGGGGVLVFDPVTGQLAFGDVDYGAPIYGVEFDRMGRLAVIADDGEVRLYDAAGKRIAAVKAPGGERPFCVAFSPDGSRLAIGYQDTTRLDVLDGSTLAPLFSPDTSGIDGGYFAAVAFSGDGTMLYAGGNHGLDEEPVFAFADGGSGARRALTGRPDTIFDLVPFGERGVIYSTGEPTIGLLDDSGERVLELLPVAADVRGALFEHFTISADAARVRFNLRYESDPVVFDVSSLTLDDSPTPEPGLRQADTTSLSVEDWQNTETPTLDGNSLSLRPYELARSLAVLPGDPSPGFLLGGDWSLYRLDAGEESIWRLDVPAPAWGVNLSADGEVAVVAYGDGTIRWHRTWDGAELLALFVHTLSRRWVAWTPSGYYAASPGGEDLIGWHLNRGWDQAPDFFPASRFRDRFYRPDIVQAVLSTLDEADAVAAANAAANVREDTSDIATQLPPVVTLLVPPGTAFPVRA